MSDKDEKPPPKDGVTRMSLDDLLNDSLIEPAVWFEGRWVPLSTLTWVGDRPAQESPHIKPVTFWGSPDDDKEQP